MGRERCSALMRVRAAAALVTASEPAERLRQWDCSEHARVLFDSPAPNRTGCGTVREWRHGIAGGRRLLSDHTERAGSGWKWCDDRRPLSAQPRVDAGQHAPRGG